MRLDFARCGLVSSILLVAGCAANSQPPLVCMVETVGLPPVVSQEKLVHHRTRRQRRYAAETRWRVTAINRDRIECDEKHLGACKKLRAALLGKPEPRT